jgi:hypothetical protein
MHGSTGAAPSVAAAAASLTAAEEVADVEAMAPGVVATAVKDTHLLLVCPGPTKSEVQLASPCSAVHLADSAAVHTNKNVLVSVFFTHATWFSSVSDSRHALSPHATTSEGGHALNPSGTSTASTVWVVSDAAVTDGALTNVSVVAVTAVDDVVGWGGTLDDAVDTKTAVALVCVSVSVAAAVTVVRATVEVSVVAAPVSVPVMMMAVCDVVVSVAPPVVVGTAVDATTHVPQSTGHPA